MEHDQIPAPSDHPATRTRRRWFGGKDRRSAGPKRVIAGSLTIRLRFSDRDPCWWVEKESVLFIRVTLPGAGGTRVRAQRRNAPISCSAADRARAARHGRRPSRPLLIRMAPEGARSRNIRIVRAAPARLKSFTGHWIGIVHRSGDSKEGRPWRPGCSSWDRAGACSPG